MSPEKLSALMARIKGKDTLPEREVAHALSDIGLPHAMTKVAAALAAVRTKGAGS